MSQNSAAFPGTPVSMRIENTQLPFIDLSRITYFIDGSFFVTDNNSISLPISNNPFPDWDVNATQGAQMLIGDDVINSALFAYWSSQELSINIGSFGQPNSQNANTENSQTEAGGAQGAQPGATEAQNGGAQGQGAQQGGTEAQNGVIVGSPPPAGGATEAGGAQKGGATEAGGAPKAGNTEAGNNNNNNKGNNGNNGNNNNNGQQNAEAGNQGAGNTEAGALKNQKNAKNSKNNNNKGGRVVGTVRLTTTQQIQKLKFWLQNGRIIRNVATSTKTTHKNSKLIAPPPAQNPGQGQGNSEAPQNNNNNNNLEAGNNNQQGGKAQNTEAGNNNNQGGKAQNTEANNNQQGGKGQNTKAANAQKQQKGNQNQESPANPQGKPNTEAGNVGQAQGQGQGQGGQGQGQGQGGQGGNNAESMTESQNQAPPVQSAPPGPSIPSAGYVFETPIPLTTELFDYIIPGLRATYGVGGNVALHCFYNSTNAPSIHSQDGSSTGIWNGTCQVWVNNGTWYQALVLYGQATVNVTIQVQNSNMISYNFNVVKIDNLSHDQSMIGNVDDQQVQNNLNMLLLWPTNVKNSIEIPIGQNAFGNNAIALFRNGFVEILGDLNFNPVTP